jgi:transposase
MQVAASVPGLSEAVASLLRARERLVAEIGQMDRQLKAISTASPVCQALMSIPGVGVQTSAAFAAAIDDASRFKRSRTAGAYFGLIPRRHQSGELDWTGPHHQTGRRHGPQAAL